MTTSRACRALPLLVVFVTAEAFVSQPFPAFRRATATRSATINMDVEGAENRHMFRFGIERRHFPKAASSSPLVTEMTQKLINLRQLLELEETEAALGMPWEQSIDESTVNNGNMLLYMPFWEWQMQFVKKNLTNLRVISCTDHSRSRDFSFHENREKGARIVNICLASDEYSKIRMTYYDAGNQTQVFTSVWYPNPAYNLPILGMDLLQFNGKKHLAVIDFQPIQDYEQEHSLPYEHLLQPIRDQYRSLQGEMSSKFYDEAQFFSNQMLFARFEDSAFVQHDLFPAFQSYIKTHVDLVKATPPNYRYGDTTRVLERHAAYDSYCAQRDPALGLFERIFGKEWADSYVHEFLFSMSKSP